MKAVLVSRGSLDHVTRLEMALSDRFDAVFNLRLGLPAQHYQVSGDLDDPIITFEDTDFCSATFRDAFFLLVDLSVHPVPWVTTANAFAAREWNSLVEGALSIWCGVSWRSPIRPQNRFLFDKKPFLTSVGIQVGANVPDSTVSTTPGRRRGEFVMKAINAWQEVAPSRYLNTRRLSENERAQLEQTTAAGPVLLQNYIPHSREYRIYLAGTAIIAILIESADSRVTDFRLLDASNSGATIIPPPPELERLVRAVGEKLSLSYLAIDVAEQDGQFWLLDVNPLASWNYLEDTYNLSFTSDIVKGWLA